VADAGVAVPHLKKLLKDEGIAVKKVEAILPSLEDVFVTLIEAS